MANAAAELFDIFSAWRGAKGSTNAERRRIQTPEGRDQVTRAMALLPIIRAEIDALDAEGRRVASYREAYQHWLFAILAVQTGWQGTTPPQNDFPQLALQALDTLADVLDHRPGPILDKTAVGVLRERLEEVLHAVDSDDSLDERLKAHIRRTVRHVQSCVDEFAVAGESATMEALDALYASMLAAAHSSKHPGRWERFLGQFFLPTAAGLLANGPGLALQITQAAGN